MTGRTVCRRHGTPMVRSLVDVPYCAQCHREDHAQIERLVRDGLIAAKRVHEQFIDAASEPERAQ